MTDSANLLRTPSIGWTDRPLGRTISTQMCVIRAVILHDIKSRFFGNGLGYLVTILWPGAHVALVVILHSVKMKTVPYGNSAVLFAITGVAPYIFWSYIARFTSRASRANKSFLQYPIIRHMDLIAARLILEIITCFIIIFASGIVLYLCQVDVVASRPGEMALGLASAIALGIGCGVFNSTISSFFPYWDLLFIPVFVGCYLSSGAVLFNPESLPTYYANMLSWNPLVHSVELTRFGYYDDYPTRLLSVRYIFMVSSVFLTLGLIIERIQRLF